VAGEGAVELVAVALLCAVASAAVVLAVRVPSLRSLGPHWRHPVATQTSRPIRLRVAVRVAWFASAVFVPTAVVGVFCRGGLFFSDDFVNFADAQRLGLSLSYLAKPTSAHFAPGHRFGDWFLQRYVGPNEGVALILVLVGFAAVLVAFHRLAAELLRPGTAPILLTFLFGMSTVQVGVVQWWASALDRLPATFFTFVSLAAYVRYFRTRRRMSLVVSVTTLVAALLFYVKPVFLLLYVVLLRVLVLDPGEPVRRALRRAATEWRVWLAFAVPTAVYAVVYVHGYSSGGQLYRPSAVKLATYLGNLWFFVVAPGAFGLLLARDSALNVLFATAAQAGVIAAIVWTIRRRAGTWRSWAFLAIALVPNVVAVGLTRIGYLAPRVVAHTLFYNLEPTWLLLLAAAMAVCGTRFSARRPAALARRMPRPAWTAQALTVAVALFVVLSLAGDRFMADHWAGRDAGVFLTRTHAALARLSDAQPRPAVVDSILPSYVIPQLARIAIAYSTVLPLVDRRISFDTAGHDIVALSPRGTATRVRFVAEAGGDAAQLLAHSAISVGPATPPSGAGGLCLASASATASAVVWPQSSRPRGPPDAYLSVRYTSRSAARFAVAVDEDGTGRHVSWTFSFLTPGADHGAVVQLPRVPFQRVYLAIPPAGVCLARLEIGHLVPAP
jgi:hypothetical protein